MVWIWNTRMVAIMPNRFYIVFIEAEFAAVDLATVKVE